MSTILTVIVALFILGVIVKFVKKTFSIAFGFISVIALAYLIINSGLIG